MYSLKMKDLIRDSFKGITPNYVDHSNVIVLNKKCIRNNQIDFSLARFHDSKKTYPSKKELQVGDILINSTGAGTAGRCAFIRELPKNYSVVADSHILVVRISDFFIAGCVQYGLFNIEKLLQTFLDGSTGQGEFDKQRLLNVIIPIPNNPKYIYQFLSNLDKKIALNKQINARLEEMAKTLYDYWFVQFDFPDANGKPYKSSGGDMVFDETLKREIPKGWEVKQISHWIKADKSGDWGKEQEEGNYTVKVNCVRGADINAINLQGNIETPIRFILAKNEHKLLSPFDFVVEISGGSPTQSTGRLAPISQYVLDRFDLPLICSNFCKAISLKDTSYFYQFAFMWSDIYKNNILFGWEGKTSGIKNLLFDNFVNGYFECFPPKEIAEQFFKIIDKNHQEQQLLLKQNHQLTQLRDFLLPMLMNGQVSVAE